MGFLRLVLIWAFCCYGAMVELPFGTKYNGRAMGGELGLDPYEAYFSLNIDLRKRYTIREIKNDELELYGLMLKNAFVPGYFSVQASSYPLLWTSAWLQDEKPEAFHNMDFASGEQNVMTLLSSEYTDPFAFSVFLGEIMNFRKQVYGKPPQSGYGLMGYILTVGTLSSYNNVLLWDNWLEFKWRVKGLKKYEEKFRTWDMMLGYIFHENPQFYNVMIVELSRLLKSREKKISWLTNTEFKIHLAISPDLSFKTIWNKQGFGFSTALYYPVYSSMYVSFGMGIRREFIKDPQGKLQSNYQLHASPSLSF